MSDKFDELKERIEKADREIRKAAAESEAELHDSVEKARTTADDHAAKLRVKSKETSDKNRRQWLEAQSNWDDHVRRLRARMDEKKAELDVERAAENAYEDETDALDAIDFASSAVAEAEYAVLNALQSEKKAEEMKQALAT
jgi:hypothetical protein